MTAMLAITRMTVRQVLGLRRLIGLTLLAIAPAGIFFLSTSRSDPSRIAEGLAGATVGAFINLVVPVITLIMASSVLGSERRDQTLSFLVLRPLSRLSIAGAKLVAAFVTAFALTGIGALALGILALIRLDDAGYVVPMLVGTAIATLAYAAIFMPLGYITERATLIGLAYVFVWENGIAGALTGLAGLSPWRLGFSALVDLAPASFGPAIADMRSFALGDLQPGAGGSTVKVLVLAMLSVAVTGWILRRRDLA